MRRWRQAHLNVFSGILQQGSVLPRSGVEIAGWLYLISGDHPDEPAMPHKCPRCDADYRRRHIPTPLRNHRTGFQKACQVIASALCREMPETQDKKIARKLVIFSDSRQDAAKLAAGMERDHFRDMIRLALIGALNEYWDHFEAFVRRTASGNMNSLSKIESINPRLHAIANIPIQPNDDAFRTQFQSANPILALEMMSWLGDLPPTNQQAFDTLMRMMLEYPETYSPRRTSSRCPQQNAQSRHKSGRHNTPIYCTSGYNPNIMIGMNALIGNPFHKRRTDLCTTGLPAIWEELILP